MVEEVIRMGVLAASVAAGAFVGAGAGVWVLLWLWARDHLNNPSEEEGG